MPIDMRWYDAGNIVLATFTGNITTEEHNRAMMTFLSYLDAASHPVHAIIDWQGVTMAPSMVKIAFAGLQVLHHHRVGWIVVVGATPLIENWVSQLGRLRAFRYHACQTIQEAAQFLHDIDAIHAH